LSTIPLSKTLASLRQELRDAMAEAKQSDDLWFLVQDIELEFQVVVTADADGKVGFSVLGFDAELGGGGGRQSVQRIKLKLGARGGEKKGRVYSADEGDG
jgi:hypothetical protein